MAYRNGVYVAFDGNGETDPTKGDLKYLGMLRAWDKNGSIDFKYTDSHLKNYQVRDDSQRSTLVNRLRERMRNSKSMIIILSDSTNYDRGMLNEEIKWAVEDYHLPLIVAYAGYDMVLGPSRLRNKWPKNLEKYIDESIEFASDDGVKCIHVAFKEKAILEAIKTYKVDDYYPEGPLDHFTYDDYFKWGYVDVDL